MSYYKALLATLSKDEEVVGPPDPGEETYNKSVIFNDQLIEEWKNRTVYINWGDHPTTPNSYEGFARVKRQADSAVSNSAVDRFDNFDTTQGLNGAYTELASPWVTNRKTQVDDKEPRPDTNGDHSAISILSAATLFLTTGQEKYATPVITELLWYSSNQWLDFTNRNRWRVGNPGMADRNPGFHITFWLVCMSKAYDHIRTSTQLTSSHKAQINKWLYGGADFFWELMLGNLDDFYDNWPNDDLTVKPGVGTYLEGYPYSGATKKTYSFSSMYNNRRGSIFAGIMYMATVVHSYGYKQAECKTLVEHSHRFWRSWIAYHQLATINLQADFYRGGSNKTLTGLGYAENCVGSAVSSAFVYRAYWKDKPGFVDLFTFEITSSGALYDKYFGGLSGRVWFNDIAPKGAEKKSMETAIEALMQFYNGEHGDKYKWDGIVIKAYNPSAKGDLKRNECDRYVAIANMIYKNSKWTETYTRRHPGAVPLLGSKTKTGSYDTDNLTGTQASCFWQYVDLENKYIG